MKWLRAFSSFSLVLYLYILSNPINIEIAWYGIAFGEIILLFLLYLISTCILPTKSELKNNANESICIVEIQPIEHENVPIYIGLFAMALGVNNFQVFNQILFLVFSFIIWGRIMEQSYYFNFFWLFKYRIYKVKDEYGNMYYLYSREKNLKLQVEKRKIKLNKLFRINDYTFIDTAEGNNVSKV